jgi:hypothetical protein
VRAGLEQRFAHAGIQALFEDVPAPPTSSLRYRSRILAATVAKSAGSAGPIHLIGHSTGGLDGRLVLSPKVNLGVTPEQLAWRDNRPNLDRLYKKLAVRQSFIDTVPVAA